MLNTRNLHVAFHIPNLGVTPKPPLHCLELLRSLPNLALGLASGQRNKSTSDEPDCGRNSCSAVGHIKGRETDPGFNLDAPGDARAAQSYGSTAKPASHRRLPVPRFVRMSHAPNLDTLTLVPHATARFGSCQSGSPRRPSAGISLSVVFASAQPTTIWQTRREDDRQAGSCPRTLPDGRSGRQLARSAPRCCLPRSRQLSAPLA